MPRVVVVGLGGTIARTGGSEPDSPARLDVGDVVRELSSGIADLELVDFRSVSSSALTLDDLAALAHLIHARRQTAAEPVVIVQGTDMMEETAWALASLLPLVAPIAITGAMRLRSHPSPDGDGNVLDALRVALHPDARELGPVVVMGGEIHLARWVRKVETSGINALRSPGFGPVGSITEDRVQLWARSTLEDYLGLPDTLAARVEVVGVKLGSDELPLLAAAGAARASSLPPPAVVTFRDGRGHRFRGRERSPGCARQPHARWSYSRTHVQRTRQRSRPDSARGTPGGSVAAAQGAHPPRDRSRPGRPG